ncbi:hypothetical protein EYF80_057388 [Liparis tanakae]|uniref:Uncharacterized protein n=1 Tax=Liparis tanakae TaxID=230148 RepID=A0A4Z2EW41_9TELE|nr:hypothetical protein EYF80_057388 [Liparis tanakae]
MPTDQSGFNFEGPDDVTRVHHFIRVGEDAHRKSLYSRRRKEGGGADEDHDREP